MPKTSPEYCSIIIPALRGAGILTLYGRNELLEIVTPVTETLSCNSGMILLIILLSYLYNRDIKKTAYAPLLRC